MLKVILDHDSDVECPNDSGDGQWRLYSFCKHRNFKHPTELGLSLERDNFGTPKTIKPALGRKLQNGLAFFLSYFEHGNSLWFRRGTAASHPGVEFQWDGTSLAGLLVWEHPAKEMGAKTQADRAKDADAFLAEYTQWANGEAYYYRVEDEQGKTIDSCGGFFDAKYMLDEVRAALNGREYEVEGDASYLADNENLAKQDALTPNEALMASMDC
jgi:hypothetical protein